MRNVPASRSSMAPKTDGPSKRGRHIHSTAPDGATSAHVSQSLRNAYSAIGGDGENNQGAGSRGRAGQVKGENRCGGRGRPGGRGGAAQPGGGPPAETP